MEFKGTKGEWKIGRASSNGGIPIDCMRLKDDILMEVCEVWGVEDDRKLCEESKSNAKLIAVAPELLKALMLMIKTYEGFNGASNAHKSSSIYKAQQVINKALN